MCENLTALIEGYLYNASAEDELVKLAMLLIAEEALEVEAIDAVGGITANMVRYRGQNVGTSIEPRKTNIPSDPRPGA